MEYKCLHKLLYQYKSYSEYLLSSYFSSKSYFEYKCLHKLLYRRNGFPTNLEYKSLHKTQVARWAHKHVADGVAHFKKGEHTEAFQLLNKALKIDPENVEAFVAKGALWAFDDFMLKFFYYIFYAEILYWYYF